MTTATTTTTNQATARLPFAVATWDRLRHRRDSHGLSWIDTATISRMIRERLKVEFPGTKFSVRKTGYDSVSVSWNDGPFSERVEEITSEYIFGGFDGMIDLAYSKDRWLHPDGKMSLAHTAGTEGSMGSVASSATDCPEPGAVMVRNGPKYVFCSRELSLEYALRLAVEVANYYGIDYTPGTAPEKCGLPARFLGTGHWTLRDLFRRYEAEKAAKMIATNA